MTLEKILFAGGCHVVGYPVGEQYAFPRLAVQELREQGILCQARCVPHVPLHHPEMVVNAFREFQPDIVVLQVANFELVNPLSAYFRSLLGLPKAKPKPRGSQSSGEVVIRPVGRWRFLLEARAKQAVDYCFGHPLVDLAVLDGKLETFLRATAHCGARETVVMSCTPCADPTQLYYRRLALPLIAAAAARHGCEFLDLLAMAPPGPLEGVGAGRFYADTTHLGAAGQMALSRGVAASLRKMLQRAHALV